MIAQHGRHMNLAATVSFLQLLLSLVWILLGGVLLHWGWLQFDSFGFLPYYGRENVEALLPQAGPRQKFEIIFIPLAYLGVATIGVVVLCALHAWIRHACNGGTSGAQRRPVSIAICLALVVGVGLASLVLPEPGHASGRFGWVVITGSLLGYAMKFLAIGVACLVTSFATAPD